MKHQRKNKKPVDRRYSHDTYQNGYARRPDEEAQIRVGKTGFLDKSMHGAAQIDPFSDSHVAAQIGNDFSNGHRGMARAIKGAKKFVRSRVRAKAKMKVRQIEKEITAGADEGDS
tara:strand:- start:278 stop:622 length:345 start_codon:yes stop_codon:yes gene_type:complete